MWRFFLRECFCGQIAPFCRSWILSTAAAFFFSRHIGMYTRKREVSFRGGVEVCFKERHIFTKLHHRAALGYVLRRQRSPRAIGLERKREVF